MINDVEDHENTYRRLRTPATIEEIGDRIRRIETRLTTFLISQGIPIHIHYPKWNADEHTVSIPSMDCSIKDILATVPSSYFDNNEDRSVEVYHRSQHVICFFLPEKECHGNDRP